MTLSDEAFCNFMAVLYISDSISCTVWVCVHACYPLHSLLAVTQLANRHHQAPHSMSYCGCESERCQVMASLVSVLLSLALLQRAEHYPTTHKYSLYCLVRILTGPASGLEDMIKANAFPFLFFGMLQLQGIAHIFHGLNSHTLVSGWAGVYVWKRGNAALCGYLCTIHGWE